MTHFIKSSKVLIFLACLFIACMSYGATIVGSKHDISTGVPGSDEPCIFCHTPHNASTAIGAPLWNRYIGAGVIFSTYQRSDTMVSTPASTPNPVSLACLSCHDGVIASNDKHALLNDPVTGGRPDTHSNPNCDRCHTEFLTGQPSKVRVPGTDLRNDHPISTAYPIGSAKLHTPPNPQSGWTGNDLKLYAGNIECSTCHNVHDPGFTPFLRRPNDASSLCLTCHVT